VELLEESNEADHKRRAIQSITLSIVMESILKGIAKE
jgi:hypothetical protein